MDNLKINEIGPACLKEFLIYMSTIKGRSNNTLINYYSDLKMFFRYIKIANNLSVADCDFGEIRIDDLDETYIKNVSLNTAMEYLYYMTTVRKNSVRARTRRAVSLRKFYEYLTDKKMWFSSSPMEKLELPQAKAVLPKHLTVEQALQVLNSYTLSSIKSARDYCILTFFLNCGMRLSELVGLSINDIKCIRDPFTDVSSYTMKLLGKGSKERIIFMNDACIAAYNSYLKYRSKIVSENKSLENEKALFLSRTNKRISNRRVQQIIENALKANNLDNMGFSVHKLRHTAATLMYQNGVDVRVLKEILGHASLETTQIYTHVANEQIRQAMDKNPLVNVKIKKKE